MKVTTKDLKDKNACPEATEWFEEEFDGVLECEWTRENQIALIKDTDAHKYFGWAVRNTLVSEWAMSGSNFGNADLRDANLRSANLRHADLRSANLRHADLYNADLRSANLRHADLYNADLRSANLRHADLRDANLRSANLRIADLRDANLRHADLRHADLRDARTNEYTKFPEGFDKEGRL